MAEPTMMEKILLWARGEVGKTHGDWECWHFVDAALTQAGAKSSTTTGKDDDYVWGDLIDIKEVKLGDVLQFRDFVISGKTRTEYSSPKGHGFTERPSAPKTRGHHTAIVDGIPGPGLLSILETHVKPAYNVVQRNVINIRSTTLPGVTTHEDYGDDNGNLLRGAAVTRTVTIVVEGTIRAYRPKPKKK